MLCAVCDFHRDMTTHSIASSAARCAPLSALRSRSSASICVLLPRPLRPELCQRSRGACQCECVWSQLFSCIHNHALQVTKQLRALLFACDASLQCVSACYYEVVRERFVQLMQCQANARFVGSDLNGSELSFVVVQDLPIPLQGAKR